MQMLKDLVNKLTGGKEKETDEEPPEDHSHDSEEEKEACQFC